VKRELPLEPLLLGPHTGLIGASPRSEVESSAPLRRLGLRGKQSRRFPARHGRNRFPHGTRYVLRLLSVPRLAYFH